MVNADAAERLPPFSAIPPDVQSLADYARHAQPRMSASAWAYLNGGAADEHTLQDNRAAFKRLRLRPRALADLRDGHSRLSLFGQTLAHPILLAPIAYQRLAHADGERASAEAAAALGGGIVLSTQSSVSLEEVATAGAAAGTGAPRWFQLYLQPTREATLALVRRAEAAGYGALVLTVDAPVQGLRDRERRAGFVLPPDVAAVNLRDLPTAPTEPPRTLTESPLLGSALLQAAPTWEAFDWLRGQTTLPILLKGILTGPDAQAALAHGADGLVVSNHGGRSLDTLPATLEALPEVVTAVAGRVPVLLDGGIQRGTDVLKALALGAQAVLLGRPYVHALACAGGLGVAHALHLLRAELEVAMALTGCATLSQIGPGCLWDAPPHSSRSS